MTRLCVTADDYGMHATMNAAIEELAAGGHISAVAVMVHADAVHDTLDILVDTGVSVGLHLVLTQEQPLLPRIEGTALASLGKLPSSPLALIKALVMSSRARRLLADELQAQVARYKALGLPLNFINTHQHVHEIPVVWNAVAALVKEHQPKALRSAHVQPLRPTAQGALASLSRVSRRLHPVPSGVEILSPLGAGFAGKMSLPIVEAFIDKGERWHRDGDSLPELVVHPALNDAPLLAQYG
ncbi:MAG: ChbG/HpnK family deacetylase, partial [Myxococcales bacterium]|nr:ChbG/HpnK family deacetylase [Myxococcales bacterium]